MTRCPSCDKTSVEAGPFCPHCGTSLDSAFGTAAAPTVTSLRPGADADLAAHARPLGGSGSASPSIRGGGLGSSDGAGFAPGQVLAGRYRIIGLLGRGGMGEVYRADDLKLGQPVALKFLPSELSRDPGRLERFIGEVRIARQVSHPSVCRVYDIGELDGQHFLSMEFVDGEDLASLLTRIGRLPTDKGLEIARQLCAGLAAAHDKGVLHRDLKPANVMIDGRGRARITDFGLAVRAVQGRSGGEIAGTPSYMAPEQLQGREISVRSDIYSLGVVLYEIFTGKQVFHATTMNELMKLHAESRPESPGSYVEHFDPVIERVILRCLERDPAARPRSALAVAAALPGGDPLAAALEAGETPSPEMVAAAGGEGALRLPVAVLCFGSLVAGLGLLAALAPRTTIVGRVGLAKSPSVLIEKAQTLLGAVGYTTTPADFAHGFQLNSDYVRWVETNDRSPRRWDDLALKKRPAIYFWYRQGPFPLQPENVDGQVWPNDPPPLVSGMALVVLDSWGRLTAMTVVPPQVEERGSAPDEKRASEKGSVQGAPERDSLQGAPERGSLPATASGQSLPPVTASAHYARRVPS